MTDPLIAAQRAQIAEHGPYADNGAFVNLWTDRDGSELCYLCALADDGSFGLLDLARTPNDHDALESLAGQPCDQCQQPLNIERQYSGLPLNDARRTWLERSRNLTSSQLDAVLDVLARVS